MAGAVVARTMGIAGHGLTTDAALDAAATALPETLKDGQGREFRLQRDPVSGDPQYRHAATQRDAAGSTSELEILITLRADGGTSRRTTQQLTLANGDSQREQVTATYDAAGLQVGEVLESATKQGTSTLTEKTSGSFRAGELVGRETDVVRLQREVAASGEVTEVEQRIHGTWSNGGEPLTDDVVPMVDRTHVERITSPGQGIHVDTPRTIVFTKHGAGPLDALRWDTPASLVVRFEGRGGQYIERELAVPVAADGTPDVNAGKTVRSVDRQSGLVKGLTQARIWGGLVSNIAWIVGINMARGSLGGIGKGLLATSAVASGAQLVGETHALATRRNDGDMWRVASAAYDTLLTGALAAVFAGRNGFRSHPAVVGGTALGAAGLAINGSEALLAPLAGAGVGRALADARIGSATLAAAAPLDGWRGEQRFDAAAILAN